MSMLEIEEREAKVIALAAEELAIDIAELEPDTRLDQIFSDSLEYIAFTLKLSDLGHLTEEAIANAETLGDLAHAIVYTN